MPRTFNADEQATARLDLEVTIGGEQFVPRKQTNDVDLELIKAQPPEALRRKVVQAAEEDSDVFLSDEDQAAFAGYTNKQVAVLLNHVGDDWDFDTKLQHINVHLDAVVADALLKELRPPADEKDDNKPNPT